PRLAQWPFRKRGAEMQGTPPANEMSVRAASDTRTQRLPSAWWKGWSTAGRAQRQLHPRSPHDQDAQTRAARAHGVSRIASSAQRAEEVVVKGRPRRSRAPDESDIQIRILYFKPVQFGEHCPPIATPEMSIMRGGRED